MKEKKKIKLKLEDVPTRNGEDLVGAAEHYACKCSDSKYGFDKMRNAFIVGAHWSEEQFAKQLGEIDAISMKQKYFDDCRLAGYGVEMARCSSDGYKQGVIETLKAIKKGL